MQKWAEQPECRDCDGVKGKGTNKIAVTCLSGLVAGLILAV